MLEFVQALREILNEIPRCGPPGDTDSCLYELDTALIVERFRALQPNQRLLVDGCWRAFSALTLLQSIVHAGAEQLNRLLEPAAESLATAGLNVPLSTAGEISKLADKLERYINIASTPS